MKTKTIHTAQTIHCIGIGGSGLGGLAGILCEQGKTISGSDEGVTARTKSLEPLGTPITLGHRPENLPKNAELVIYSLAIPQDNVELIEARKRGLPTLTYPEAVGQLTQKYRTIAICGTHGKTTITALIAKILIDANYDPTVIVGSELRELENRNFRTGKSKLLILEACEYKRAFHSYHPNMIVLSTLDYDHVDYYPDFTSYLEAYKVFAKRLPKDGWIFTNLDDDDVHEMLKSLQREHFPLCNTFTFASNYAVSDYYLKDHELHHKNERLGTLKLSIPGLHNRMNALAAFSLAHTLGVAPRMILRSLRQFKGTARRFETKGKMGTTTIIDDYGHHPAEIRATLQAAREAYPKEKICVVFQPHQYSRTKHLIDQFAAAFSLADGVIIPSIYEARDSDEDKKSMSVKRLVAEIQKYHKNVRAGDGLENTAQFLREDTPHYDVIITMGAGDVWKVGEALLKKPQKKLPSKKSPA
ncbi:UDP-N-acetylmuramate--L-alanine ligase [Candidatus Peregrinibacteria bacterium CG_4_9_14_0_2_um_filter_53_11]|nr:MAG: UDP-N-acetylmuramate--L-alanine ligase [Candidatus Peregrinibacteria bacterium CG_4_9_14_0_2_um_filter_53_11]